MGWDRKASISVLNFSLFEDSVVATWVNQNVWHLSAEYSVDITFGILFDILFDILPNVQIHCVVEGPNLGPLTMGCFGNVLNDNVLAKVRVVEGTKDGPSTTRMWKISGVDPLNIIEP